MRSEKCIEQETELVVGVLSRYIYPWSRLTNLEGACSTGNAINTWNWKFRGIWKILRTKIFLENRSIYRDCED